MSGDGYWPGRVAEDAAMQDLCDAVQRAHPEASVVSVTIIGEARVSPTKQQHVAEAERPFVADRWRPPAVQPQFPSDRDILCAAAVVLGVALLALALAASG